MYLLILCCSLGAAVQGWDETAVNGAQLFYTRAFHIDDKPLTIGFVNAAPYISSAFVCLLAPFVNSLPVIGGRKRVIRFSLFISALSCLLQAFPQSWQQLLGYRLLLGLGIGLKSVTIPIYVAECAPAELRGAFVMTWQLFTALGIFFGYLLGYILFNKLTVCRIDADGVHLDEPLNCAAESINWKVMLALPGALPLIPLALTFLLPESPRFLLRKALANTSDDRSHLFKYGQRAIQSLVELNTTNLQAYREAFLIYCSIKEEKQQSQGQGQGQLIHHKYKIMGLWTHERTRRALWASILVMFLQQACGVNVLAYYSTSVLGDLDPDPSRAVIKDSAFGYSLGFGAINFSVAFLALFLIDYLGRRLLLLTTFPLLGIFQFVTGKGVGRGSGGPDNTPLTVVGMYLFCFFYSIGEGPVPFVYAAESMPIYHRDYGMGVATFFNWIFNALLGVTWPYLSNEIGVSMHSLSTAACVSVVSS
ncbi:general substrate transporter [Xylaria arbuscula]|nr:general substrate transporter [Xylaria arbuscula]